MSRPAGHIGPLPALLFATLLVVAQIGSALHSFEHDPDSSQSNVCATCVGASQLASACVDTIHDTEFTPAVYSFEFELTATCQSTHECVVRQRGPPSHA